MSAFKPLLPGEVYHVYNRAVGEEDLFREERNYAFFLTRYRHHVAPAADTLAYCLLRNHFHLVVRLHEQMPPGPRPERRFANLFISYAKACNAAWGRNGALFSRPFKRVHCTSERHLNTLIRYVHRNAEHHGFVPDFRQWPHSSYHALLDQRPTRLARTDVVDRFGGLDAFRDVHHQPVRWIGAEPEKWTLE
jgi:hypothetical protein